MLKTSILLGVLAFFTQCENDLSKVQELTAKQDSAIISVRELEMTYTINSTRKVLMSTPLLNRYIEQNGEAYSDFPEGVYLEFYDDAGKVSSTLRANYSIFKETEGIWEAKYDVEAINEKHEKLNTEYLIWHQKTGRISTDQFVTMTTNDGVIYGDGFESNEDFTSWEVVNGRGVINVDNEK